MSAFVDISYNRDIEEKADIFFKITIYKMAVIVLINSTYDKKKDFKDLKKFLDCILKSNFDRNQKSITIDIGNNSQSLFNEFLARYRENFIRKYGQHNYSKIKIRISP